jgi:N-carbamoyl-L-amino-acid hydrolase
VGLVRVSPNSRNVIAGSVFFTVDLRHPDDAVVNEMAEELERMVPQVADEVKVEAKLENNWNSPAMRFDEACMGVIRAAAEELGYRHRDIVSGAGHDAVYIARVAPTGMIFIPCQNGISHNEAESAQPQDVAAGANVLLRAVLAYDRGLG